MSKKKAAKDAVVLEKTTASDIAGFLFEIGTSFLKLNNAEGAFESFKRVLDLDPQNYSAAYNLGVIYHKTGNHDAAYRVLKEATRMRPSHVQGQIALAGVATKVGRFAESEALLDKILQAYPDDADAVMEKALLEYSRGSLAKAKDLNEKFLSLRPGNTLALLNQALVNMTYGDWENNWGQYEYSLTWSQNKRMQHLTMQNAWAGDERPGQTLLVVSDQGFGDAIQFAPFLADAKEKGKFAKIIYLVQPEIVTLLRGQYGIDEVIGFDEGSPQTNYDTYSALLGIMRVLGVKKQDAFKRPALTVNEDLKKMWESMIARELPSGRRPRVALVWAGDPKHGADTFRSVPLEKFRPLLDMTGVDFLSFQVGPGLAQLGKLKQVSDAFAAVVDIGGMFRDFADTAAALSCVDVLVSVDTSIVHLAGRLGYPFTMMAIANPPEWRWGLCGAETRWYDTVSIFRQGTARCWEPVLEAIREQLTGCAAVLKGSR